MVDDHVATIPIGKAELHMLFPYHDPTRLHFFVTDSTKFFNFRGQFTDAEEAVDRAMQVHSEVL